MEVKYNGASANTAVLLNQAAPGIFVSNYSTRQAAVVNADGTLNSPANPAKQGSVVSFYGTGGGPTNPPGADGAIWPSTPLARLTLPVSVQIGGVDADVLYAGSAPGMVSGIFQINVQVPALVSPSSRIPIVVTIGGFSSSAGVAFLAVE